MKVIVWQTISTHLLKKTLFRWLESVFDQADPDKLGCIPENQAVQLIKQLNSRILLSRVKHKVKVRFLELEKFFIYIRHQIQLTCEPNMLLGSLRFKSRRVATWKSNSFAVCGNL